MTTSERLEGEGEEKRRNGGREREHSHGMKLSWYRNSLRKYHICITELKILTRARSWSPRSAHTRSPPSVEDASVPDERARHVEPENLGVADVVVRRDELPIDGVHAAGRDVHQT